MKVTNKSRKIIAINEEPLLPGTDMELPEGSFVRQIMVRIKLMPDND